MTISESEPGARPATGSEQMAAAWAIRRLLADYVFFADRGRVPEFVALFTEDGVYRNEGGAYDGMRQEGAAEITRYLESIIEDFRIEKVGGPHRHHISSTRVEFLAPGRARAESYFWAVRDIGADHWGIYREILVERDGRWLFAERLCRVEGTSAGSWQHAVRRRREAEREKLRP